MAIGSLALIIIFTIIGLFFDNFRNLILFLSISSTFTSLLITAALVLSIVGWIMARRKNQKKELAKWGVWISVASIVLSIGSIVMTALIVDGRNSSYDYGDFDSYDDWTVDTLSYDYVEPVVEIEEEAIDSIVAVDDSYDYTY